MTFHGVLIVLILLCFLTAISTGNTNPNYLKPDIFVNCGSAGTSAAVGGREWIGDEHPKFYLKGKSTSSTVIHKFLSTDPIVHKTARISYSKFSYSFHLNPGQKIIRLHFNPASYNGFKNSKDLFTLEAGPFTLMSNFSASLTAHALGVNTLTKEFYMSIEKDQSLDMVFFPANIVSRDRSYAFVNGIEIISVPAHLSYFHGGDPGPQLVGKAPVYIDNNTALEIVYKSDGELHTFGTRATFLKQNEGQIRFLTWKQLVDVGFRYLVRVRFSKLGIKMAEIEHVVLKVLINEMVVDCDTDEAKQTDEIVTIRYVDYLVAMKGRKQSGKRYLYVSLNSNNGLIDIHEIVEGFEIIKLSNHDNSLSSPNPSPPARTPPSWFIRNLPLSHGNVISGVAVTIIALVSIIIHMLHQLSETNIHEENKQSVQQEEMKLSSMVQEENNPSFEEENKPSTRVQEENNGLLVQDEENKPSTWADEENKPLTRLQEEENKSSVEAAENKRSITYQEEEIMPLIQEEINNPSAKAKQLCRCFSFAEMQSATQNFSDELFIGRGGFGTVYKGLIDGDQQTVAIKRLNQGSHQGTNEFVTEIKTLSQLRHINLVSLIGYCNEREEMILVYEYMTLGTLSEHLYGGAMHNSCNYCPLSWIQRLNICIGAGRALEYLHTGYNVIHRDVKDSNILLDENLVAKVADFGLAKPEDNSTQQSYISTDVKGTIGYLDPHYLTSGRLTRKSDTYAFGVVLLQVLFGKPAVDQKAGERPCHLVIWFQTTFKWEEFSQFVAPGLVEGISEHSFNVFVKIAEECLVYEPKKRPTMSHVVVKLENALEQLNNGTASMPKRVKWEWNIFKNIIKPAKKKNEVIASSFGTDSDDLMEKGLEVPVSLSGSPSYQCVKGSNKTNVVIHSSPGTDSDDIKKKGLEVPILLSGSASYKWSPSWNTDIQCCVVRIAARYNSDEEYSTGGGYLSTIGHEWIQGFSCKFDKKCSHTEAGLRSIREGLKLAWELRIESVNLHSMGSWISILKNVKQTATSADDYQAIITECHALMKLPWKFSITSGFSKFAKCAVALAEKGNKIDEQMKIWDQPPEEWRTALQEPKIGSMPEDSMVFYQ